MTWRAPRAPARCAQRQLLGRGFAPVAPPGAWLFGCYLHFSTAGEGVGKSRPAGPSTGRAADGGRGLVQHPRGRGPRCRRASDLLGGSLTAVARRAFGCWDGAGVRSARGRAKPFPASLRRGGGRRPGASVRPLHLPATRGATAQGIEPACPARADRTAPRRGCRRSRQAGQGGGPPLGATWGRAPGRNSPCAKRRAHDFAQQSLVG